MIHFSKSANPHPHGTSLATNITTPGVHKSTLFLGDLSSCCTERDINDVFSPYGEIVEIKVMRSDETQRSLCFGFVKFASPHAAKKALNGLNGVLICGRNLRLGWACYKSKKDSKLPQHHDRIDSSAVHVSYVSQQLHRVVTEESLRMLFSAYGVVIDTSIKKTYWDDATRRQCGYGFVHFSSSLEGMESALKAVAELNDQTVDGVTLKCSASHNLKKQIFDLRSQRQRVSAPHIDFAPHNHNHHSLGAFASRQRDSPFAHSVAQQQNHFASNANEFPPSLLHSQHFPPQQIAPQQFSFQAPPHFGQNERFSSFWEQSAPSKGLFDDVLNHQSRSDSLSDSSLSLSASPCPSISHTNRLLSSFSEQSLLQGWQLLEEGGFDRY